MKNDNNQKESTDKIPHIFPFNFKMPNERNESKFMQKSKEYMKNKKAVSMKHIFDGRDKISININQSININANPNSKFPEPKKKETKNNQFKNIEAYIKKSNQNFYEIKDLYTKNIDKSEFTKQKVKDIYAQSIFQISNDGEKYDCKVTIMYKDKEPKNN